MASGKSTVGKVLHQLLDYDYFDLDNFIEKKLQHKHRNYFKTKGEIYFREIERKSRKNYEKKRIS